MGIKPSFNLSYNILKTALSSRHHLAIAKFRKLLSQKVIPEKDRFNVFYKIME